MTTPFSLRTGDIGHDLSVGNLTIDDLTDDEHKLYFGHTREEDAEMTRDIYQLFGQELAKIREQLSGGNVDWFIVPVSCDKEGVGRKQIAAVMDDLVGIAQEAMNIAETVANQYCGEPTLNVVYDVQGKLQELRKRLPAILRKAA